jgi:predicted MFS family arabinose efflux permease
LFLFAGAGAQQQYILPFLHNNVPWPETRASLCLAGVYIGEIFFRVGNLALYSSWPDSILSSLGSLTYVLFPAAVGATYFTHSFPLLMLAALIWGWGGAALWTGSSMQALRYGESLRGKRLGLGAGLLYGGTDLGFLTGVVLLGVIRVASPHAPYLPFFVAAAITSLGSVLLFTIKPTAGPVAEPLTWCAFTNALSRVKVKVASFLMLIAGLAFGTMLGPLGRHIEEVYGPQWLWITAAFFPAARMAISLSAGFLADYVVAGALMAGAFALSALGLACVPLWHSPAAMALAAFALGLLQGTVPVVATAMVGKSAVRTRRALPHAIIFSFRDLGVSIAVVGSIAAHQHLGKFEPVFFVFATLFLICGALALLLKKHADEKL